MLTLLLPVLFASAVEVERVLALVNNVPVLASDVELAEVGALVPREPAESDADYSRAVLGALVDLELRWQDLQAAGIATRAQVDLDAAWRTTVERAGGEEALRGRLAAIGFNEGPLRELVRRAAVVQSYVATRFGPFVRPTAPEVETFWQRELAPELKSEGKPVPPLDEVRPKVEALLRERKLSEEIDRWTAGLAKRAEVVRYLPPAAGVPAPRVPTSAPAEARPR